LIDELKREHNIILSTKQLKASNIHKVAQQHGLLLAENKPIIQEGWVGKPKGILQILHERGLIVGSNYKTMTLDGRKDPETREIEQGSSLHELLEQCNDFKNELSAMQLLARARDWYCS